MAKRKSRADRYADILESMQAPLDAMKELKEELEAWRDNMPENLQGGSKYEELEDSITELDDVIQQIEEALEREVSFPGAR